ncbi:MAG: head GIN domain-containing protein [Pseudomonadota bacterium]
MNKPTKTIFALALAFSAAAFVPASQAQASGWFGENVQGNGTIKKQSRDIHHFNGVSLALSGNVELKIGSTEGVSIETDENLLPLIETVVENGTLRIRAAKKNVNLNTRNMRVTVWAKDIDRVSVGGSGSIESDALKGSKLNFDVGGSGSINVKGVEADNVVVSIGGSGNFKSGAGSTNNLSLSIGGSGDVQAGGVKSNDVSVSVGGSGQATVWAQNSLSISIAGSGDVNYYGDPKISKSVAGSGGAKRLGAAPR